MDHAPLRTISHKLTVSKPIEIRTKAKLWACAKNLNMTLFYGFVDHGIKGSERPVRIAFGW